MIRAIINADDLGKNEVVNEAIADGLTKGVITSSTIIANTNYWSDIHRIIVNNTQASFGVHLNLTEGKALTKNDTLLKYGVVDDSYVFTNRVRSLDSYPSELFDAIYQELDAQVYKVLVGESITVSHLDGHHHIHTFYPFRDIISDIAEKYSIKKIRNRYSLPRMKDNPFKRFASSTLNYLAAYTGYPRNRSHLLRLKQEDLKWKDLFKSRFTLTDYFSSYESAVEFIDKGGSFPGECTLELMCHPGHPKYEEEYHLIKRFVFANKIHNSSLINYNQLSA